MARLKVYNETLGQWEYIAYGIPGTDGDDGREVELQKSATHIQWRYVGDASWTNLVALTDIKGDQGIQGDPGDDGADGLGVPAGGTAGQVLTKDSSTDNDTSWQDAAGGVDWIPVTVSTAAATAAKTGTTTGGTYTPATGDLLLITFSSGSNVNSATLNIDGSGAKNIRLGNVNVTTATLGTTSAVTLPLFYDGTYYQIFGSQKNDNTTYTEITEAEITTGTASTARAITGRRSKFIQDGTKAVIAQTSAPTDTNKLWYDTDDESIGYPVDDFSPITAAIDAAIAANNLATYPVGELKINRTLSANPNTYIPGLEGTTWVPVEDKMIMGRGSTYTADGGSATHNHSLGAGRAGFSITGSDIHVWRDGASFPYTVRFATSGGSTTSGSSPYSTRLFGNTDSGDNIPPMIVAYIWERTA